MPIAAGTEIMVADMLEYMERKLVAGNNTTISLQLDSREESDKMYARLFEVGKDKAPMTEQFWGYWGCCLDRFGVRWMFNVMNPIG